MKVVWLKRARLDLSDALDWIKTRNPTAAQKIAQLIHLQTSQLAAYPQLGRVGQIGNTRELVIQQTRYIAAYRIDIKNNNIEILALMHHSKCWPDQFKE